MPRLSLILPYTVEYYGPGEEVPNYQPGDFILTHGEGFFSKLIRFGQGIRFRGDDAKYSTFNHAALVVDDRGGLVEAIGAGVSRTHIKGYKRKEYVYVRVEASDSDRAQAVAFAEASVGQKYGWATIVSIALGLLTGGKLPFNYEGSQICSGLVARSLERTGVIFKRTPSHIMPADLAKYYEVPETKFEAAQMGYTISAMHRPLELDY